MSNKLQQFMAEHLPKMSYDYVTSVGVINLEPAHWALFEQMLTPEEKAGTETDKDNVTHLTYEGIRINRLKEWRKCLHNMRTMVCSYCK